MFLYESVSIPFVLHRFYSKKPSSVCTFSWYCISFAVEMPRIVSLRPSVEETNKVYQKDQRLQVISLVWDTSEGDKNQ